MPNIFLQIKLVKNVIFTKCPEFLIVVLAGIVFINLITIVCGLKLVLDIVINGLFIYFAFTCALVLFSFGIQPFELD